MGNTAKKHYNKSARIREDMPEPWYYFCERVSAIFEHILITYTTLVYANSNKSLLNHF